MVYDNRTPQGERSMQIIDRAIHALNNHMSVILGNAELLGMARGGPESVLRDLLREITLAATRAAIAVQELERALRAHPHDAAAPPAPAAPAPAAGADLALARRPTVLVVDD